MIDITKLEELVRLMVDHDLTELDLRDAESQVTVRRASLTEAPQLVAAPAAVAAAPAAAVATAPEPAAAATPAGDASTDGLSPIESPMVGTFYTAANPDSPPFVSVGDRVTPETVVCLIEAMKIFNEIKAECSGVVERVLVSNADSVEFGQGMFLVRPD